MNESLWPATEKAREVLFKAIVRDQRAGLLLSEIATRLKVPLKTVETLMLDWLRR